MRTLRRDLKPNGFEAENRCAFGRCCGALGGRGAEPEEIAQAGELAVIRRKLGATRVRFPFVVPGDQRRVSAARPEPACGPPF